MRKLKPAPILPGHMTVPQLAVLLNIGLDTAGRLVRLGRIPSRPDPCHATRRLIPVEALVALGFNVPVSAPTEAA